MQAQRRDTRRMTPVMIAVLVAIAGQAAILLNDFGAGNGSSGDGKASVITAAAVSRAGAIQLPSVPLAARTAS
jgi:hypothetical protein